jgi:hypothetical protein
MQKFWITNALIIKTALRNFYDFRGYFKLQMILLYKPISWIIIFSDRSSSGT